MVSRRMSCIQKHQVHMDIVELLTCDLITQDANAKSERGHRCSIELDHDVSTIGLDGISDT